MGHVYDILAEKGGVVHTTLESTTVLSATREMNERQIGAMVVMNGQRVAGIFTERDVLRRIVAEQRDPSFTHVGDVMTKKVVCCQGDTSIEEARTIMRNRHLRHLPVVGAEGQLIGLISIGDLNAWALADDEATIQYMSDYIHGRA